MWLRFVIAAFCVLLALDVVFALLENFGVPDRSGLEPVLRYSWFFIFSHSTGLVFGQAAKLPHDVLHPPG